jgi:hypothetical protein
MLFLLGICANVPGPGDDRLSAGIDLGNACWGPERSAGTQKGDVDVFSRHLIRLEEPPAVDSGNVGGRTFSLT